MIGQTDETQIVLDLLNAYWNASVVAKPTIAKKSAYRAPDVAQGDWVLGYRVARTATPLDSAYTFERVRGEVALDVRTDSDSDVKRILSEIRRIMWTYRTEAGDVYDYLDYQGIEYTENYRNLFRAVCSVRLMGGATTVTA